jgi:hypothetical protein
VANEENLKPIQSEKEARELGRKGGIASGKARKEKKTMREILRECLNMECTDDDLEKLKLTGKIDNGTAVTLGLILGAKSGNAQNYKQIVEMLGELTPTSNETPQLKIEIVDNKLNMENKGE